MSEDALKLSIQLLCRDVAHKYHEVNNALARHAAGKPDPTCKPTAIAKAELEGEAGGYASVLDMIHMMMHECDIVELTEAGQMSIDTLIWECGCKAEVSESAEALPELRAISPVRWKLHHCPLHGAAGGLREALKNICEGRGPYSTDRLTHASNTIDYMRGVARAALASAEPKTEPVSTEAGR